ncbi:MAG: LPXTG cell wall anchor domain-containing protein [Clostridia bacterium]|nr:LPXTG cell wall anchor domain-containing protein [Clostridia bacterium]
MGFMGLTIVFTIAPAKQAQTINAPDVTATYGDTDKAVSASVTTPATGGGAISYTVKDGSGDYIDVASDGKLTIKKVPASGKAYVIVKAEGTDDYAETTKEVTVNISTKAMTVSAEDVTATVDGQPHGITVNVTDPATGSTVKYGTEAGTYNLDASPTQTEAGEKTVYYQVTADNYTTYTGSAKVTVSAKQTQTITASDVTATYGDTGVKINASTTGDGGLSYAVKSGDAVTVDASGNLTIVKAGTAVITVTAAETDTYAQATKDVNVTVNTKAMTVSAEDVNVTVDGQPHGITVNVTDPATGYTVKYGTEAGSYTLDASPTQTEVGEKTVYYQVTADNYTTYTGSAKVTVNAKQTQTITAENVTAAYGDTDKKVTATTDGNGTISYAVKDGSADYIDVNSTTGALTIKKVGTATVIVTAAETSTYAQATKEVTVTINKASALPATVIANNRTYDGTEKPLVTVTGTATGGTMNYALGTATEATEQYTTSIPTATNAGTYYVWYMAKGDENHADSASQVVTVVIAASAGSETGNTQTQPGAPAIGGSNMAEVVKSVVAAIENGTLTDVPNEVKEALAQPGAEVTLTLVSKPLADGDVPAADKTALNEAVQANGYDGYQPFDLSLLLTVTDPATGNKVSAEIHVSSKSVTFSLQIPENLRKQGRTFFLLHVSGGKVNELRSTTGNVLEGNSKDFSTYAIAYRDAAEPVKSTFYFRKVWEGSTEKSIDFTLYSADGKVVHQGFDKRILNAKEWSYYAVFNEAGSCYVVEKPIPGYITRYVNVGEYAGITDRCCNGGTIINKKIPKTGDETPLLLWAGMLLVGAAGLTVALTIRKRKKAHK